MIDLEERALCKRTQAMRTSVETGTEENHLPRTGAHLARDRVVDGARAEGKVTPHTERNRIENRVERPRRTWRFFGSLQQHANRRRHELLRDRIGRERMRAEPGETTPRGYELCGEARFSFSQIGLVLRQIGDRAHFIFSGTRRALTSLMSMNERDSGMPREHRLSSFIHRVSPGKLFGLIFFVHAMKLATGCSSGPADGASGGKCKDDGCHTYCDDGPCDNATGTCDGTSGYNGGGGSGGSSSSGSNQYCVAEPWSDCDADAGEVEMYCVGEQPPGACRMVGNNDMLFCCAPIEVCDGSDCDGSGADGADATGDANSDAAEDADANDF